MIPVPLHYINKIPESELAPVGMDDKQFKILPDGSKLTKYRLTHDQSFEASIIWSVNSRVSRDKLEQKTVVCIRLRQKLQTVLFRTRGNNPVSRCCAYFGWWCNIHTIVSNLSFLYFLYLLRLLQIYDLQQLWGHPGGYFGRERYETKSKWYLWGKFCNNIIMHAQRWEVMEPTQGVCYIILFSFDVLAV